MPCGDESPQGRGIILHLKGTITSDKNSYVVNVTVTVAAL